MQRFFYSCVLFNKVLNYEAFFIFSGTQLAFFHLAFSLNNLQRRRGTDKLYFSPYTYFTTKETCPSFSVLVFSEFQNMSFPFLH